MLFLYLSSDTSNFLKDIKIKLSKIDEDMKANAHQLSLDPSCSSAHFIKIIYLIDLYVELLREEARIIETCRYSGKDSSKHGCIVETH